MPCLLPDSPYSLNSMSTRERYKAEICVAWSIKSVEDFANANEMYCVPVCSLNFDFSLLPRFLFTQMVLLLLIFNITAMFRCCCFFFFANYRMNVSHTDVELYEPLRLPEINVIDFLASQFVREQIVTYCTRMRIESTVDFDNRLAGKWNFAYSRWLKLVRFCNCCSFLSFKIVKHHILQWVHSIMRQQILSTAFLVWLRAINHLANRFVKVLTLIELFWRAHIFYTWWSQASDNSKFVSLCFVLKHVLFQWHVASAVFFHRTKDMRKYFIWANMRYWISCRVDDRIVHCIHVISHSFIQPIKLTTSHLLWPTKKD